MNKKISFYLILFLIVACVDTKKNKKVNTFEPREESLIQNYEYPEWFGDAKFGIYTHWGPVTYANQFNDRAFGWYGRLMYNQTHPAYEYHRKHFGDQKEVGYKDIIKRFDAANFNAEEWATIFAEAGAKFAGPVAVHHDNYLMWDSDLSPWNAVDVGPERDISGELEKAIRANGMKFMASFHHGFSYRFYEDAFEYDGYEAPMLYGKGCRSMPPQTRDTKPWKSIPRDHQELFLAKVQEFTRKYQPDLIYYDFGMGWHDEDIRLKMYSDYYNEALASGRHATVAQKAREGNQLYYSTLDLERGRMSFLAEYPWMTDDSPGSWFYYPNPKLQTANTMIDRFVDIVSKNGCLLLNIGPDYKGKIPVEYRNILNEYGKWLKVNGEAVYNTRPWYTYGEGATKGVTDYYGAQNSEDREGKSYTEKDIRFTQSKDGENLYAFILHWPEKGSVHIKSLAVDNPKQDLKVMLLGYDGSIEYVINEDQTLTLDLSDINSAKLKTDHAWCFRITGGNIAWHPQGHYWLSSSVVFKDENHPTAKYFNGEISYPIQVDHGHRDYEIVAVIRNSNKDTELEISMYNELNKREGGPSFKVKLPVTDNEYELLSLGELPVTETGKYFLEISVIKGDISSYDISDLFIAVVRDQTILKVGDSV